MKFVLKTFAVAVVFVMFLAAPLQAQQGDTQITPWISQTELQGDNEFEDGLVTDFEDSVGMGISVNRFIGSFVSIEASAFSIRNEANLLLDDDTPIGIGKVRLIPITLGGQFHLARRSRIDPYVGAGAAWVMASELSSPELEAGGVGRIELDDKATYYLNAGIGFQISSGFGIVLDGRYLPYETTSRSTVTGVEQDLELSPRILSLGLRLRF